jgi:hypothetical protein
MFEQPPPLDLPIHYEDLRERLNLMKGAIYKSLAEDELLCTDFKLLERFQQDANYREALAEVLLTAILWIEAGRPSSELLQGCVPEIRKLLVRTVNLLLQFLVLKEHTQTGAIVSRGSLADAWTHLLVEFHRAVGRGAETWWWKLELPALVPPEHVPISLQHLLH